MSALGALLPRVLFVPSPEEVLSCSPRVPAAGPTPQDLGAPHPSSLALAFGVGRADQSLPGLYFYPLCSLFAPSVLELLRLLPGAGCECCVRVGYRALGVFVCKTTGPFWRFEVLVSEREGFKYRARRNQRISGLRGDVLHLHLLFSRHGPWLLTHLRASLLPPGLGKNNLRGSGLQGRG